MPEFVLRKELGTSLKANQSFCTTLYELPNLKRFVLVRVIHGGGTFRTVIFESNRKAKVGDQIFEKELVTHEEALNLLLGGKIAKTN